MRSLAWAIGVVVFLLSPTALPAQDAKVTVVAILASDRHKDINPKLISIAAEVRKRDSALTGFSIVHSATEPMTFNQKKLFALVDNLSAEVTVVSHDEKDNKFRISIKAPHAGEITYTTVADKFFPVLTRYQTDKDKERLIFAVMVKPLPAKVPDKAKEP